VQGVNCLQDLKTKLTLAGFEIKESGGWFVITGHGKWTMTHGVIYLENNPIKNISEAPLKKKVKTETKSKPKDTPKKRKSGKK
jgi:hypothetical protein